MVNPKSGIIIAHHTRKIDKKALKEDPFQALSGAGSLRGYYSSGIIMYQPDEQSTNRRLVFELRNGISLPSKLIGKSQGQWVELNEDAERIVNQDYGQKLDKERERKSDIITQIIAEEALVGRLYSSANQFAEYFENKDGLGSSKSIRDRISLLATKGHIKFIKETENLGFDLKIRASKGILCVKNMHFKTDEGVLIHLLPTHYKSPQTGASLPVENPEIWVIREEDLPHE